MLDAPTLVAGLTRYERSDFEAAYREVPELRGAAAYGPAVPFILLAIGATVAAVVQGGDDTIRDGLIALFFAALAGLILRQRAQLPARTYDALPEWQRQVRFELTGESLWQRNEKGALEQAYELFTGWHESPGAFYVRQAASQFVIIPKRAFASDEEIDAVRDLLAQHVPVAETPSAWSRQLKTLVLWVVLVGLLAIAFHLVNR